MIKIDHNYTDYRDDTDPKYPGGKAVNATTAESTDGTPLLADWMNDINGALQAIFIEAFGNINKVSGKPDNVRESDVLKAIKKITQEYTDKTNAVEVKTRAQGDVDTLESAKSYTDQRVRTESQTRVQGDADVFSAAKNYADQRVQTEAHARARGDADVFSTAKNYADQRVQAEAQTRAQGDAAIQKQLETHIKGNNPHGISKEKIGLGNVNNTSDEQKSVKYAATAGSAKANGGNADTVGGFKAGTGTGMLVPVTAFSIAGGTGYIKFGNGLLLQWGTTGNTPGKSTTTVYFPVAFSSDNYSISGAALSTYNGRLVSYSLAAKKASYISVSRWCDSTFDAAAEAVWFIAIGR